MNMMRTNAYTTIPGYGAYTTIPGYGASDEHHTYLKLLNAKKHKLQLLKQLAHAHSEARQKKIKEHIKVVDGLIKHLKAQLSPAADQQSTQEAIATHSSESGGSFAEHQRGLMRKGVAHARAMHQQHHFDPRHPRHPGHPMAQMGAQGHPQLQLVEGGMQGDTHDSFRGRRLPPRDHRVRQGPVSAEGVAQGMTSPEQGTAELSSASDVDSTMLDTSDASVMSGYGLSGFGAVLEDAKDAVMKHWKVILLGLGGAYALGFIGKKRR